MQSLGDFLRRNVLVTQSEGNISLRVGGGYGGRLGGGGGGGGGRVFDAGVS